MITRADLKRFSPKAKPEYIDALMGGMENLREAGILESEYRLCHFLAQVGHETGGFTIIRESMKYSPKRMREVWPARFRSKSEAELKRLAADPVKLGDAVYGGRMGNRKGGSDGYDYRGGGFIQTTGKYAVEKYARALGIEPQAGLLDDLNVCLKFAALEWKDSQCNVWADENDLTKVCKAINTGSATSNIKPVGMADRQRWFAKAWSIWGDKGAADVPVDKPGVAVPAAVATGGGVIGAGILTDPVGLTSTLVAVKGNAVQLLPAGLSLTGLLVPILVLLAFCGAAWLLGRKQDV
jgi:predicted chitinase